MAIFLTGSTGYLGSYLATGLFRGHRDSLNLLVRAQAQQDARERLWQSLQLHMEFPEFQEHIATRTRIFLGDLTNQQFGLADDEYHTLVESTDSLIHCAASLNRKSEKQCLNVNLRGTLEVIQLACRAQDHHGLRRFFARLDRGRRWHTPGRSRPGRQRHRLGALRLRSLRSHQKILRTHDPPVAPRRAAHHFSSCHRARR